MYIIITLAFPTLLGWDEDSVLDAPFVPIPGYHLAWCLPLTCHTSILEREEGGREDGREGGSYVGQREGGGGAM